jgi:hypothetical protein
MELNWDRFESLPGLAANNFEKLCRSIVRRHFGCAGALREIKNQPGVEFYICLKHDVSQLGLQGETVGWQCKWFEYRTNGELTSSARGKIEDSLEKTVKHLPSTSHWILWTHKTLSKKDQQWYYGLEKALTFKLHLWNADDVASYLTGPALDLRQAYFGELALNWEMLAEQHGLAVAPISSRWMKLVHQQTKVEREIRQSLGESESFNRFKAVCKALDEVTKSIEVVIDSKDYEPWQSMLQELLTKCRIVVQYSVFFSNSVSANDFEQLAGMREVSKTLLDSSVYQLMSRLRKHNLPLSIEVTNAVAFIKDAVAILKAVHERATRSFIAVLADAGGGKT